MSDARDSAAPRRSRTGTAPDLGTAPTVSASGNAREREIGADLPVGHVIADKYRIERILGRGGMGVVYAARHIKLDEPVAIKVLRSAMLSMHGMVQRFVREARAASKIKSDHVARVTDVDQLPTGAPYMVMEYLEGIDLGGLRKKQGPLPVADAAAYIAQACDAIAEAHSLGIVHRDLKPSNLFLARRREDKQILKVLDFGISKFQGATEEQQEETTRPGLALGSPKYMSPEQMRSARDVDHRTDIWALGAILYELLAGRPPFVAPNMAQVCQLVVYHEPPDMSEVRDDVPAELLAIVQRCLKKQRDERYSSAAELARALLPFCEDRMLGLRLNIELDSDAPPPSMRIGSETGTGSTHTSISGGVSRSNMPVTASEPKRRRVGLLLGPAAGVALGIGAFVLWRAFGGAAPQVAAAPAPEVPTQEAPAPAATPETQQTATTPGAAGPDQQAAVAADGSPAASPSGSAAVPAADASASPSARPGARTAGPRRPRDPFGGSRN